MLKEHKGIPQDKDGGLKRWFSDDQFDLIVWAAPSSRIEAFQLCYGKGRGEQALTWSRGGGFRHGVIDGGEGSPLRNDSPVLKAGKPFDGNRVVPLFEIRARGMDPTVAAFVSEQLKQYAGLDPKRDGGKPGMAQASGGGAGARAQGSGRGGRLAPAAKPRDLKIQVRADSLNRQDQLPEDLMRKVRRIELGTRKMVSDVMSGSYRSQFKGHGVQFSEHRVYNPGDDIRYIDWKVSARSRDLLIKKFEEERELTVFLIVDISGSKEFGSVGKLKAEVAAEIGGMLAYAATHTGDKVGVLLFAGEVEKIVPPKKGRMHVLRIVRELLGAQGRTSGTDLAGALDAANRIMKHSGIVFLISDFISGDYEIPLRRLSARHDVISLWLSDPRERKVPDGGMLMLHDPETGGDRLVDLGSYGFRRWFSEFKNVHEADTTAAMNSAGVERLKISTEEDYGEAVIRFFRARARRRR